MSEARARVSMKAIVQDAYGSPDRLRLRDVDVPVLRDDEVLVRMRATSVHADVWHVVRGQPFILRLMGAGLVRPKKVVPGTDLAGVVEAVGTGVTRFKVGDEVFGECVRAMQWVNGGAYAELVAAPERALALKPTDVSFEQAAAVPSAGLIAISALRKQGRVKAGDRVLINGAGGGVGALAVQIAKGLGAHVTGVDRTDLLELVRALGADAVVDYTRDDFTTRAERYHLIVDIPGNHSFARCARVLLPTGLYVLVGHDQYGHAGRRWLGSLPRFIRLLATSLFSRHLPKVDFSAPDQQQTMELLRELLAAGKLTPIIDRTFPLAEAAAAIGHLESGHARGRIILTA